MLSVVFDNCTLAFIIAVIIHTVQCRVCVVVWCGVLCVACCMWCERVACCVRESTNPTGLIEKDDFEGYQRDCKTRTVTCYYRPFGQR